MTPAIRAIVLGSVDRDAAAWRAAVFAAGGALSNAQFALVNALIRSLKVAGVWSALDRLWLFAAENATQALIDLKARATATAVNSPTFTANRGYQGDASAAYVNSGFNPSTGSPLYSQDDCCFGAWVETANSNNSSYYLGNAATGNNSSLIRVSATQYNSGVNTTGNATFNPGALLTGFFHSQRTASNAYALYQNATSAGTATDASGAIPNRTFFLLAVNNGGGSAVVFGNGREASFHAGKSMTAGQISAFYAAMRTYMTAVGVA